MNARGRQCCDWQSKPHGGVSHARSTHVPSLPGANSHDCPNRAHFSGEASAGALFVARQPIEPTTASSSNIRLTTASIRRNAVYGSPS